jgi:hypothetical protein
MYIYSPVFPQIFSFRIKNQNELKLFGASTISNGHAKVHRSEFCTIRDDERLQEYVPTYFANNFYVPR